MRDIVLYEIRKSMEEINALWASSSGAEDQNISQKEQMLADTVTELVNLSQIARKEGLLALEDSFTRLPESDGFDTLKMLMRLIVDGTDPDLIEEMALMKYFASAIKDYSALQHLIMMIGAAAIQAGENPRVLEEELALALPKHLA